MALYICLWTVRVLTWGLITTLWVHGVPIVVNTRSIETNNENNSLSVFVGKASEGNHNVAYEKYTESQVFDDMKSLRQVTDDQRSAVLDTQPQDDISDFVPEVADLIEDTGEGDAAGPNCGDGLCRCYKDIADCTGHPEGFPYIPKLPQSVYSLNLSNNGITQIPGDYFTNVTKLRLLCLSKNDLQFISPHAFTVFTSLYSLNIDFNVHNLLYNTLLPVVHTSSIEKLSIRQSGLGQLPSGFFNRAALPNLTDLLLYDNFLGDISLYEFQGLTSLQNLGLANNKISQFEVNVTHLHLERINLNSNGLFYFPVTCDPSNQSVSFFPNLTHLLLRHNTISAIPKVVCLPKLKVLLLAENDFSLLPTNTFSGAKFPQLVELYLYSMNNHISNIFTHAFNNSRLERISLTYNSLTFDDDEIHVDSFANCQKLSDLQISHNFLSDVSDDHFLGLFGHLPLRYLYMESCQLPFITRKMLSPFKDLEYLSVNRNLLAVIADGVFDDLIKLKKLDLSNNQIAVVSPDLFGPQIHESLKSLDLSGNPFECSCKILEFQKWLISAPTVFKPSWTSYMCFNFQRLPVAKFVLNEQACILSRTASILIVAGLTLIIVTFISCLLFFRYRWHLRLVFYEAFRNPAEVRRRRLETCSFDYDVFVSFDSDDQVWVREHLMLQLEGRLGLKLCVHQRDFIVGKYIVDNIVECVDKSKKVMMLFSKSFSRSQWCQFELSLCLRHAMDCDDELLIVCLDDLSSRDLTAAMMAVLKTTTYIQWVDNDVDAATAFWERLRIAFQEIMPTRTKN